jgi:hypothetical protein
MLAEHRVRVLPPGSFHRGVQWLVGLEMRTSLVFSVKISSTPSGRASIP